MIIILLPRATSEHDAGLRHIRTFEKQAAQMSVEAAEAGLIGIEQETEALAMSAMTQSGHSGVLRAAGLVGWYCVQNAE